MRLDYVKIWQVKFEWTNRTPVCIRPFLIKEEEKIIARKGNEKRMFAWNLKKRFVKFLLTNCANTHESDRYSMHSYRLFAQSWGELHLNIFARLHNLLYAFEQCI